MYLKKTVVDTILNLNLLLGFANTLVDASDLEKYGTIYLKHSFLVRKCAVTHFTVEGFAA